MIVPQAQTWSAPAYAANARFVADLGAPLLDLLDARPGERVLDLGCGDGALTMARLVTAARTKAKRRKQAVLS